LRRQIPPTSAPTCACRLGFPPALPSPPPAVLHKLDASNHLRTGCQPRQWRAQVLDSSSGTVNWTVPAGNREIVLPRSQFRSGPTPIGQQHTGPGRHPLAHGLPESRGRQTLVEWTSMPTIRPSAANSERRSGLPRRRAGFASPLVPALLAESRSAKVMTCVPTCAKIAPSVRRRGSTAPATSISREHRVYADTPTCGAICRQKLLRRGSKWLRRMV